MNAKPTAELINQLNSISPKKNIVQNNNRPISSDSLLRANSESSPDILTQSANLLAQLLANGPNHKVLLDTGRGAFDRMILHKSDAVDALGYPLVNGLVTYITN